MVTVVSCVAVQIDTFAANTTGGKQHDYFAPNSCLGITLLKTNDGIVRIADLAYVNEVDGLPKLLAIGVSVVEIGTKIMILESLT